MRDPRVDPETGDIIQPQQYTGFPKPPVVRVSTILGELVACIREGDVFWVTIEHFRHIYKRAEVVPAPPAQAKEAGR